MAHHQLPDHVTGNILDRSSDNMQAAWNYVICALPGNGFSTNTFQQDLNNSSKDYQSELDSLRGGSNTSKGTPSDNSKGSAGSSYDGGGNSSGWTSDTYDCR